MKYNLDDISLREQPFIRHLAIKTELKPIQATFTLGSVYFIHPMFQSIVRFTLVASLAQGSVIPMRTSRTDPCVAVCEEFSAARRGNGTDMCDDPLLSQCVLSSNGSQYFCTHLYWARTEDGQRGLTYSTDASELSSEESSHPVTCLDAIHIVGPRDVGTLSPDEIHYWTPTIPPTTPCAEYFDEEAERRHAIAAGWPQDWRSRSRSSTTGGNGCTTGMPSASSTTTTTTPFYMNTDPEQMRIRAIAGGWPEPYFRMYGTTPTPPPERL